MTEFNLDDLIPRGEELEVLKKCLAEVDFKIDETVVNYKFVMQMVGEDSPVPSKDVLTFMIAKRYALAMKEWDGSDLYLPFLFARLTALEVLK